MKKKKTLNLSRKNNVCRTVLLAGAAFAAGTVNGFLGTGGGIVLMFALSAAVPDMNVRDRFATLIAVILPLSLISALVYGKAADMSAASPYILPGIMGGAAGALLLDRLSVGTVKRMFALMVIWAGINFLR